MQDESILESTDLSGMYQLPHQSCKVWLCKWVDKIGGVGSIWQESRIVVQMPTSASYFTCEA